MIFDILESMLNSLLPFWWVFLIAIVFKILTYVAKSPKFKGAFGEKIVAEKLRNGLPEDYKILNDVYLPLPDGTTTQVDHVIVSQYGIFVVETKTYSGWIFGDENSPQWTQTIYNKKSKFQNPIRQNYKHICALSDTLGIEKSYFIGVVVFCGDCEFKGEMPKNVIYSKNAANYILKFLKPLILIEQLDEIVSAIEEWQASIGEERKSQHVENLKKRHAPVSNGKVPLCPYCGEEMVLRKRKNDGTSFYGCKKYPKCRGIVDVK